ncbi:unnamed protein product [Paramecium octaurelia]|uniref:Uncharacterized protein n=1 Tax=Paramecium octaurelia TaxID=43137 RepID=A0A8S1X213_PAROT|nr:unnamed protein product [Paramecium octaurelia]
MLRSDYNSINLYKFYLRFQGSSLEFQKQNTRIKIRIQTLLLYNNHTQVLSQCQDLLSDMLEYEETLEPILHQKYVKTEKGQQILQSILTFGEEQFY